MFLSLDIVPFMVMKYPGDFMGNGRVLLSGCLAPSKEFGVILWDGRSPFLLLLLLLLLFCFVFQTPLNEGFQSRALGSCDWTTRNLVKNWGLGICQAHYDI